MITRVLISGLDGETVARIDRVLGGTGWRFDIRPNGKRLFDVDVANNCDVMYVSSIEARNALVLSVGEMCAGLKRDEFSSIIAG